MARALARVGGAKMVLALAVLAPAAVTVASATATAQLDDGPTLVLVDQDIAVEANGELRIEYVLRGADLEALELIPPPAPPPTPPTTTAPGGSVPGDELAPPEPVEPDPPVELTIEVTNYAPLTDPSRVTDVVGSAVDPDAFESVVDGVAITDLRDLVTIDGDDARFTLEIGTDVQPSIGDRLRFDDAGVYPIRVQILVGDPADDVVVATAGTIVERVASPGDPNGPTSPPPPIDLAIATVVEAPPIEPTAERAARAESELLAAIDVAAEVDAPMTLEVPPPVVAAVFDAADDPAALQAALIDDEFVSLPAIPLDVSSAVAADRADVYTRLVNAGEDLLSDVAPATPTRREAWIATDELSAAGAQHLRDLGSRFVAMTAALYADTVDPAVPATDQFVEATLPDGGTMPLLVVETLDGALDPDAADRLLATRTDTEWATATIGQMLIEQRAADLELERPARRSRVLAAPDLGAPDARLLRRLDEVTATTPSMRFSPASALGRLTDTATSGSSPVVVTLPEVAGPPLGPRLEQIDAVALTLLSAGSMLPDDDPRRTDWQQRLDGLVTTGLDDDDAAIVLDDLLDEAARLSSAVQLPEPFTFTLTGRSGTIEIRLTNTIDETLQVVLALDSTKLDFPEGEQQVTLRPLGETSVIVPVEARANGTSSVDVAVTTPIGDQQLDEPIVLTSRVTTLTGLGQVLTGGLVLVLLTWWLAHWRAKRRAELADDGRSRHPSSKPADAGTAAGEVGSGAL